MAYWTMSIGREVRGKVERLKCECVLGVLAQIEIARHSSSVDNRVYSESLTNPPQHQLQGTADYRT